MNSHKISSALFTYIAVDLPFTYQPADRTCLRDQEKLILSSIITFADRANEIIRRQELAEERKARLAELGSVAKKKKGKKGKKKGTGKKKGETTVKKKSIC